MVGNRILCAYKLGRLLGPIEEERETEETKERQLSGELESFTNVKLEMGFTSCIAN